MARNQAPVERRTADIDDPRDITWPHRLGEATHAGTPENRQNDSEQAMDEW
jgi:hypothetical protein